MFDDVQCINLSLLKINGGNAINTGLNSLFFSLPSTWPGISGSEEVEVSASQLPWPGLGQLASSARRQAAQIRAASEPVPLLPAACGCRRIPAEHASSSCDPATEETQSFAFKAHCDAQRQCGAVMRSSNWHAGTVRSYSVNEHYSAKRSYWQIIGIESQDISKFLHPRFHRKCSLGFPVTELTWLVKW